MLVDEAQISRQDAEAEFLASHVAQPLGRRGNSVSLEGTVWIPEGKPNGYKPAESQKRKPNGMDGLQTCKMPEEGNGLFLLVVFLPLLAEHRQEKFLDVPKQRFQSARSPLKPQDLRPLEI